MEKAQKSNTQEMKAAGAVTAAGAGSSIYFPERINGIVFRMDSTSGNADSGDLLDVYVQTTVAGSTSWLDIVRFQQVAGDAADHTFWQKVLAAASQSGFGSSSSSLAANAVRHILGTKFRERHAFTAGGSTSIAPSFNFSLTGTPM